jgi:hypothetical protein
MERLITACPLLCAVVAMAQVPAPDFTITTTDGLTHDLFTELDAGRTVVLDFFYPTCQGCWYYAPIIEQSYVAHGSGTGSIVFWGINGGELGDDAEIEAFRTTYGVTIPCASGLEGNGGHVDSLYFGIYETGMPGYPTYVVICPDRSVSWQVNYPPTATGFDPFFTACALASVGEANDQADEAGSIFPVPAEDHVTLAPSLLSDAKQISVTDMQGRSVGGIAVMDAAGNIDLGQLPPGTYFLCVQGARDLRMLRFVKAAQ